jgi:hypothetical protein
MELLHVASEDLLDRLFAYLSHLPEPETIMTTDEVRHPPITNRKGDEDYDDSGGNGGGRRRRAVSVLPMGITLPASAIGWLAQQQQQTIIGGTTITDGDNDDLFAGDSDLAEEFFRDGHPDCNCDNERSIVPPDPLQAVSSLSFDSSGVLSASLNHRVALIRYLLPRLQHLRVSGGEAWPAKMAESRLLAVYNNDSARTADTVTATMKVRATPTVRYCRLLLYHPFIDLGMFENLRVLVLEQVPAECVMNLRCLKRLQVLRFEHSGIFDLPRLFFSTTTSSSSAVSYQATSPVWSLSDDGARLLPLMSSLKRIRLSNCSLTSDALVGRMLGSEAAAAGVAPQRCPLERLTRVEFICLSHNQLGDSTELLRSIRQKPWLSHLDLSHNQLSNLRKAPYCLGNLQFLDLSYNRIVTTQGIDRLFSLEVLWLNDNQLPNLSSIAGLTRLPLLHSLRLRDNPLTRQPQSSAPSRRGRRQDGDEALYRILVFDMLLQRRLHDLTAATTLRQVQACLMVKLDDKPASVRELLALRNRAYATVDLPWLSTLPETEDDSCVILSRPAVNPQTVAGTPRPRLGSQASNKKRRYRRLRHVAHIVEAGESDQQTDRVQAPALQPAATSAMGAAARDPSVKFSVLDVLASLSSVEDGSERLEETSSMQRQGETVDSAYPEHNYAPTKDGVLSDEPRENSNLASYNTTPDVVSIVETPAPCQDSSEDHEDDLMSAPSISDSQVGKDLDLSSISPIRCRVTEGAMKASAASTAASTAPDANSPDDLRADSGSTFVDDHPAPTPDSQLSERKTVPAATRLPSDDRPSSESSNNTPSGQLSYQGIAPAHPWHDDNLSVATSTAAGGRGVGAASHFEESGAQLKYVVAEEKSVFNAAPYNGLNIMENLELYFELFVFNYNMLPENASSAGLSVASLSGFDDRQDWIWILEHYPKIQLWPVDRRMREAYAEKAQLIGKDVPNEELRRVWREKVVACGKPALRRLTPSRGARFGFHGELLWSDARMSHIKPETIAEPRDIVMCISSKSLYFIAASDAVSSRMSVRDALKKFPLHISDDDTFEAAKWPHALAWHPLHALTGITIGFGFQRLTLRFANSTFPSPDPFTYVLLTCNKMETIRILKEIQSLASDAHRDAAAATAAPHHRTRSHDGDPRDMKIDNDDRHVLDALGVAVAPDVIGAVLHYQILSQHWRRGNRGSVRRVCVVTDTTVYLLDEDYVGDGSETVDAGLHRTLGETTYRVVDSAPLSQITIVKAADADPCSLTLSIRPTSRLSRTHNWRLTCRDRTGAEQLLEDVRKAMCP